MKILVHALVAGAFAFGAPPTLATQKEAPPTHRTVKWAELVPKDWDPMKRFEGIDVGSLKDGDPRADEIWRQMQAALGEAPINKGMDGRAIRIAGYIVPLEMVEGEVREFLLVPYFGACIHSPPPPANQIIHVLPKASTKGLRSMSPVWVRGVIRAGKSETSMATTVYRMEATGLEPFQRDAAR
jgi:hypothetical protein